MKLLILIDFQNDFISGTLGTPEAQAIVPNVVRRLSMFDGAICTTLDTHDSEESYLNSQEGKNLPTPHCLNGSQGWLMPSEVLDVLEDRQVFCLTKSSFGDIDIGAFVTKCQETYKETVDSIEICGLCTDICVISNALILKAEYPEIPIYCNTNCCAGTSPEAHEAALKVMRSCQIGGIDID